MIDRLVSWCLGNRPIVLAATVLLTIVGIDAVYKTPIDAIPDLSENQVIVLSDWAGRSAQEVEDQVTFPLSTALQGLAGVREVRAQSAFGFSMLTVIFRDDIDVYFARTRVLEKLSALPFRLPDGVTPKLGPDATSIGWIYQYYLDDSAAAESGQGLDLGQLRSLQDWFVRLQLSAVPGVAEVASIGGFVRQYQVDVNPNQLRAYGLPLSGVVEQIQGSSRNVGGGNIEINGRDITIRELRLSVLWRICSPSLSAIFRGALFCLSKSRRWPWVLSRGGEFLMLPAARRWGESWSCATERAPGR